MKKIINFLFILLISCDFNLSSKIDKTYITITFDDQDNSIYFNALPIMNEFGFKATNVINTGRIGQENLLDWNQVEELEFEHGWETAGHTLHHVNLPDCTLEEAEYEIGQDWENLVNHNLSHETFALPGGHATPRDFEIILRYYKNIRNSRDFKMKYPVDRKYIGYFFYQSSYTAEDAIARIQRGISNQECLVVLGFHRIKEETGNAPDNCKPDDFRIILEYLDLNGFEVITIKEAAERLSN